VRPCEWLCAIRASREVQSAIVKQPVVSGVREDQVCLGDVFTVDTRIVQVFKARDEFHE
jgi:hypothetical protein